MLEFAEYVMLNDTAYGNKYWKQVVFGIQATYKFVDPSTGLFNATLTDDWGRIGQSGQNIAVN